jgi:hypothetical protein
LKPALANSLQNPISKITDGCWWFMPVILVTWKAVRKLALGKCLGDLILKTTNTKRAVWVAKVVEHLLCCFVSPLEALSSNPRLTHTHKIPNI